MRDRQIVAVGLLTRPDLEVLGPSFDRAFPLDDEPKFDDLLKAIDDIEAKLGKHTPE